MTINNGSLGELLQAANSGPFMHAEIVSLSGRGKLRVTCNWLYSSLNCDPNDSSPFVWQFYKIDDHRISLSPVNSCIGQPVYASVRNDLDYFVQVQAPYSADWITGVGGDEMIGFTLHDLSIAQLTGFNGSFITVNDYADTHGNHTGFRVRSVGSSFNSDAQWFIDIKAALQTGIKFSSRYSSVETLNLQLASSGINIQTGLLDKISAQLST